MAKSIPTLTIRGLDGATRQRLRVAAAEHNVSMEEEMRAILRAALDARTSRLCTPPRAPATPARHETVAPTARAPILLIISGGIAAYKALDLIRRLRERGHGVRAVMTKAAQEFVTPLSVGALTGGRSSPTSSTATDEQDVGHIRLAREAALIVVAPATADLMARMASGQANDLATAVLLAARVPVLLAPAMNPAMWAHAATQRNVETLKRDGIRFVGPDRRRDGRGGRGRGRPHGRAAGDRRRGRAHPCAGGAARLPAATCSSPPARPTSRSTRCATSPTAPPAARATPSPRPRRRPARA